MHARTLFWPLARCWPAPAQNGGLFCILNLTGMDVRLPFAIKCNLTAYSCLFPLIPNFVWGGERAAEKRAECKSRNQVWIWCKTTQASHIIRNSPHFALKGERCNDTEAASYPDVSLKMCAQRKAGRIAAHHQSLVSRSPLPCEKRSAWGGGWYRGIFWKRLHV